MLVQFSRCQGEGLNWNCGREGYGRDSANIYEPSYEIDPYGFIHEINGCWQNVFI